MDRVLTAVLVVGAVRPPTCVLSTPRPTDTSHLASTKLQNMVLICQYVRGVSVLGNARVQVRVLSVLLDVRVLVR